MLDSSQPEESLDPQPLSSWSGPVWLGRAAAVVAQFWRRYRTPLNLVLGLGFLAYVGYRVVRDWRELSLSVDQVSLGAIALAFGLYGVTFALSAFVWHRMVVRFGGPREWRVNLKLFSYTYLAKFLPTPVWFVGGRLAAYQRHGLSRGRILMLTALEMVLQMLAGGFLLAGLSIDPEQPLTWLYLLLALPLVVVASRPKSVLLARIGARTTGLPDAAAVRSGDIVEWLLVDVAVWVLAGPFFVCVTGAVFGSLGLGFVTLWRVWIISNLAAYLSTFLLGGLGILREVSMAWMLSSYVLWPTAALIAAAARIVMTLAGTSFAGAAYLLTRFADRSDRQLGLSSDSKEESK